MSSVDFSSFFDVLEEDPFIEHPVDVRTFVRDQRYLGQPELSEIQYTLIETMSQIFREEDLKRFMGDAEGANHYKKYTKNEIIMQLGKGSVKTLLLL